MTRRLRTAHKNYVKASRAYRLAVSGERTKARKAFERAAAEVLKAESEARKRAKPKASETMELQLVV